MMPLSQIEFTITKLDTTRHFYFVRLRMQNDLERTVFSLPSWTPGSYMIRDYSRHLHKFSANKNWEQTNLSEWVVFGSGEIVIEYLIYAFEDLSVRTNHLDEDFGFINSSGLYLCPVGFENSAISISFELNGKFARVLSSLERINQNQFLANNYDELYDSPFLLTNNNPIAIDINGSRHDIVIEGSISKNKTEQLLIDLKKIIEIEIEYMGVNPNEYYLFMLLLVDSGYGGLEHASCSVNIFDPSKIDDPKEYLKLLELLAHEYFHLWNIKRIRPIALGPFDYNNVNLTRELWIAEGITSFFDAFFLLKSHILTIDEYLNKLMEDITQLEDNSAEDYMSLEESSFTAWNKFYKRNANSNNTVVSYYTKGAILVLCMYIRILKETSGKKTFTDIMKELYSEFFESKKRGFTKIEFFDIAKKVTGLDLRTEFDAYITQPRRIPVYDYLHYIGVYKLEEKESIDLGFSFRENGIGLIVNKLFESKMDPQLDIYIGDEILAINNIRFRTVGSLNSYLDSLNNREPIQILLSRKNRIKEVLCNPILSFKVKKLVLGTEINQEQLVLRESFFQ
ncbi:M61 family metallopeptidase [Leptospira sp. GIMC2001]|uniref:M61 family metallopeptidase n=1 Tax=Leptospira sp. GIMC2001 TaxID=1513297 RepID=UPI002349B08C|nr:M61 family peptidase [Leptospira sp. GIMC2001]WCL47582.1 M61 family peptidase [Leptospira sp. GIMC2001]